ncbi:MAG: M23 family metallopeptidase [Alphaproteobacteria bacterium]
MLVCRYALACLLLGAALALTPLARGADAADATSAPKFQLPVNCTISLTCEVQFHVDLAPGPEILDHACGRLTYDDHKGTDFRVPDLPAMQAGVSVLAAADGEVRAIRDGEPDLSVDERGRENLSGKDAGNAVVIAHGDGWETQYSHLMNGSVVVKAGDRVVAGQAIGKIGLSGRSNFPHLDFQVRRNGAVYDPFLGAAIGTAACGVPATPLWDTATLAMLAYRPGGVLIAGFATRPPDKVAVRGGADRDTAFGDDAEAFVFYADVFGIRQGDVEIFEIYAPDGSVLARIANELNEDAHQRFQFVGKKRPPDGWQRGTYRGEYRLLRKIDGEESVVASATREATISAR